MEGLREYVLRIIVTALICGLLPDLLQNGGMKDLVKAAAGLILALTVVSPLRHAEISLPAFSQEAGTGFVHEGEQAYNESVAAIIKEETQAYILDKAAALGAQLRVEVGLSSGALPVPQSAVLEGQIPEEKKAVLEEILAKELGIAKEDQVWIG